MRDGERRTRLEIVGVLKQIVSSSKPSLAVHVGDRSTWGAGQ